METFLNTIGTHRTTYATRSGNVYGITRDRHDSPRKFPEQIVILRVRSIFQSNVDMFKKLSGSLVNVKVMLLSPIWSVLFEPNLYKLLRQILEIYHNLRQNEHCRT